MSYALITGASSGIGRATALKMAELPINLILVARREKKLAQLKYEILQSHPHKEIHIWPFDITHPQLHEKWSQDPYLSLINKITILINNAGLAIGTEKFFAMESLAIQKMLNTNLNALLSLTHFLLPHMLHQRQGYIVNIGSVAGLWSYPGGSVYCATKAAVKAFSEGLRLDLMGYPIRVTTIEPGLVETEFSLVRLQDPLAAKKVYENMTPLLAQDIAESIYWCLTRPAHVNIQELVIFPTDQAGVGYVHRGKT